MCEMIAWSYIMYQPNTSCCMVEVANSFFGYISVSSLANDFASACVASLGECSVSSC